MHSACSVVFCPHANRGRCRSSYDSSLTRSGRTASTDPKRITVAPIIPLDRVEVAVAHRSSEDYSTAHAGQYGSYSTTASVECQSLDNTLVQVIDNNIEECVKGE